MAGPHAFFLPAGAGREGQRFCVFHPAQGGRPRASVLYLHPFAEEMNKSRRMAALQARALSQAGCAVLQMDLLGCGDSSGDFGDAAWSDWIDDALLGCQWLQSPGELHPHGADQAPLWLWGLRAGCLLATEAAARIHAPCNLMLWHPPGAGKTLLQQFMRLKAAGDLASGNAKTIMDEMRRQLDGGEPVEIAGYALSPGMALGLEQALLAPSEAVQRVAWFELTTREDAALSPASARAISQWEQAGARVDGHVVRGPSFWQTTEIEQAPDLVAATTSSLCA